MKFKSIESMAKKLKYKINEVKKDYVGSYDYRKCTYVKRWIENDTKTMYWDAHYYKDEGDQDLEVRVLTITYKNDPDDAMTDYFSSCFIEKLKFAFELFER